MLGIQCEVIIGTVKENSEDHAWNIVNYGEPVDYYTETPDPSTWYEMDVTWDDPVSKPILYVRYDCFNVTTANFGSDRARWYRYVKAYAVEVCTATEYSYENCIKNGIFKDSVHKR